MSISPTQPTDPTRPTSLRAASAARSARGQRAGGTPRNGPGRDAIAVSAEGRELLKFESAVARAAARDELVQQLKSAVDSGTYRTDPGAIARAMGRRSDA